jgi:hypothetical protein
MYEVHYGLGIVVAASAIHVLSSGYYVWSWSRSLVACVGRTKFVTNTRIKLWLEHPVDEKAC